VAGAFTAAAAAGARACRQAGVASSAVGERDVAGIGRCAQPGMSAPQCRAAVAIEG
jgi:hypothetical protein